MDQSLQNILNLVDQSSGLSPEQKQAVREWVLQADKTITTTEFKFERTEKVKRTTAVLLEETIRELDQKHREAEVEASLERVRTVAMGMKQRSDMLDICKTIAVQLAHLGVNNIRNVQTAIFYPQKGTYFNYEFYTKHDKTIITETSYTNHQVHREFADKMMKGSGEFYSTLIPDVKGWLDYQRSTNVFIDKYLENASSLSYYWFSLGNVALGMSSYAPMEENSLALFKRFLNVFELSFKRYADIEAAEKQAREAQIEAALERVRGKALAMHNSQDIADTIGLFYKELQSFSLTPRRCGVGLLNRENTEGELYTWNTTEKGESLELIGAIRMEGHPVLSGIYDHWLRQEEYHPVLKGIEIPEYYKIVRPQLAFPEYRQDEIQYGYFFFFNEGGVYAWTEKEMSEEELQIYRRFTSVLSLTYKRYNDLRQAEAQAKEAQVEASLERVRSKTMAMHNSQDMAETVSTLFSEVSRLGIEVYRCGIGIMQLPYMMEIWTARPNPAGKPELIIGRLDMSRHALTRGAIESWVRKEEHYSYELKGDDLIKYFEIINSAPDYPVEYDIRHLPGVIYHNEFHFEEGALFVFSLQQMGEDSKRIIKRFTAVFGQAYRRYLDLQKAEAQAREATIEAALERVRSRSMAMHQSEELAEVAQVLFQQLSDLGVVPDRTSVGIFNDTTRNIDLWTTDQSGIQIHQFFSASYDEPTTISQMVKGWREKKSKLVIDLEGETLNKWLRFVREEMKLEVKGEFLRERRVHNVAFFSHGLLLSTTHEPVSEETMEILERFASAFNLTYRRFLDLQTAEAQAREARIETALEKVRSRTMAMQRSDELSDTAHLLFEQMKDLGEPVERAFIGSLEEESEQWQIWATHHGGQRMDMVVKATIHEPWVMRPAYNAFKEQKRSLVIDLQGQGLEEYFQFLVSKNAPVKREIFGTRRFENLAFFSKGFLGIITVEPVSKESLQLYERFASVFDLTYTRFIDLQKAEASAKEAVKQAAVDRIRAEIASMRTTKDLERITPLIWTELKTLGVPFIRCGVFIMNDSEQRINTFLSTPDGKALAAFHIPYDTPGNIRLILKGWKEKRPYTDHWEKEDFREFADIMVQRGEMETSEQYLGTIPLEGFYLNFLPFRQGMLYAGNNEPLNEEQLALLQSLAEAFSAAYSRYEDFTELESAKQEVEKAFGELRQTQQQLVQSEKMASLGELTAGIAHEIQNPLNFVNNFSEVSKELLDEMKEELEKGNTPDAIQIAADVQQNLEKISHHGKRADAIVKSMLQHSRSSTGKKEPTDINALADEYLRLAFHGLRAKDKTFNTSMNTELDPMLGKISVVQQDIGRVFLNLVTNAFYAVSQKSKMSINGYQPAVTVRSKRAGGKITIEVEDNGTGIPQRVVDKIFQPFFTTKPTGEGTGLGLSLSYDIVTKGHGGELRVETTEGAGTKFIVELPG